MAQLPISEINFETLRQSLKTSFQNNPVFRDYNFDGSGLAVLLDVLAHDSYLKSYYLNMCFNEAFLDSALLRGPMVSSAKEIGYTPKTARSASAMLNLTLVPFSLSTSFIVVPAGTRFTGTINNSNYVFSTQQDYTISRDVNGFYKGTVEVFEGDLVTQTFVVPSYTGTLIVPIYNAAADERSVVVSVFPDVNSTTRQIWTRANDILQVAATSPVYFFQENMYGLFELQFGDGILGAAPQPGNMIVITYRSCNTSVPNGCRFFAQLDLLNNVALMTITLSTAAAGGSDKESIDSIRFNAPRNYDKQNRNITENDFKQSITSQFSGIQAISVWGGEKNETPAYGKVYISVKPTNGFTLTDAQKAQIQAAIQPSNIMAIDTVFIDATFNYIVPQVNLWYNSQRTSLSASQILNAVSSAVQKFETTYLGTFNNTFYFSRFTSAIDATDPSISGNDCHLLLQKRFLPQLNSSFTYALNFHQQIAHPYRGFLGSVTSSGFHVPLYSQILYMDDDGNGNLRTYYYSGNTRVYVSVDGVSTYVGSVDYTKGLLTFKLPVSSVAQGSEIQVNILPLLRDIAPIRNEILLITQCSINVFDEATGLLDTAGSVNTAGDTTTLQQNAFLTAVIV